MTWQCIALVKADRLELEEHHGLVYAAPRSSSANMNYGTLHNKAVQVFDKHAQEKEEGILLQIPESPDLK